MRRPSSRARPSTRRGIRLAQDLDALTRAQIVDLQAHNWSVAVAAALATPAVRRRWPDLARVRDPGVLAHLPLMSPADLEAACPPASDELLLAGTEGGVVLRSSGTSGRRKVLYHSWEFNHQVMTLGARGVRRALHTRPLKIANCLRAAGLNGAFAFAHEIARLLPALTFPMGSAVVGETIDLITEHGIDTLIGAPRFVTELVTAHAAHAIESLRNVLYIGAPLGAGGPAIAKARPDLTVRSLAYSTSETGPIGYQCPYLGENAHHIHEDAVVVEVVEEDTGELVEDGITGEVVVTPVTASGMALLRYRVGDRGRLEPAGSCPCGSAARRLVLAGRTDHSIVVDTTVVSADLLLARLAQFGFTDPTACQLQVLWSAGSYRLRLLFSCPERTPVTAHAVTACLRGAHAFRLLLDSPRCAGLTVKRVSPAEFAVDARGKASLLYQDEAACTAERAVSRSGRASLTHARS